MWGRVWRGECGGERVWREVCGGVCGESVVGRVEGRECGESVEGRVCGGERGGEEGVQEGVVYTHSTLSSLWPAEEVSLVGGSAELSQVVHDDQALGVDCNLWETSQWCLHGAVDEKGAA